MSQGSCEGSHRHHQHQHQRRVYSEGRSRLERLIHREGKILSLSRECGGLECQRRWQCRRREHHLHLVSLAHLMSQNAVVAEAVE